MRSLAPQYVSMYNEQVLDHQDKAVGQVTGSLVLFNQEVQTQFLTRPIQQLSSISVQEFAPNGLTAMFDAVGETVSRLQKLDSNTENVAFLVIILSDGMENHSKIWSGSRLQSLIQELESTGRWTFQYLGCDPEAIFQTRSIGLAGKSVQFTADIGGIDQLNKAMKMSNSKLYAARAGGQSLGSSAYLTQAELNSVSGGDTENAKS